MDTMSHMAGMSQVQTENKLEGWKPFEEAKKIIAEKGEARVYFVAVECRSAPGVRETNKLRNWLLIGKGIGQEKDTRLVSVERYYDSGGEHRAPAIRATVKSLEEFATYWWALSRLRNSSCGCSLMVNDAQGYDVRVMDTGHVTSTERPIF